MTLASFVIVNKQTWSWSHETHDGSNYDSKLLLSFLQASYDGVTEIPSTRRSRDLREREGVVTVLGVEHVLLLAVLTKLIGYPLQCLPGPVRACMHA